jgi:hypothetical protein
MAYKLNVILTCDVECWPNRKVEGSPATTQAILDHIYGFTRSGDQRGITWQMQVLSDHGLRGVFFVESLFGTQGFAEPLKRVVESISEMGHDAELHAHTEWYGYFPSQAPTRQARQHLESYSYVEQVEILEEALAALKASGAGDVVAFRAGNFAASDDTLRALAAVGLIFDSSYNAAYLGRGCQIQAQSSAVQPFRVGAVWEYPVTCFQDRPAFDASHLRPLQIAAASRTEMRTVLLRAHAHQLHAVVILTHSFEMTHFSSSATTRPREHRLNMDRFRDLCTFLEEHKDFFRVVTFRDVARHGFMPTQPERDHGPLISSTWNYVIRGAQNFFADRLKW